MNKNFDDNKIDDKTKSEIENFMKSKNAESILKNMGSIDKDKVLNMFSKLSKEDIKKGLSMAKSKNVSLDKDKLKKFMKDK